MADVGKLSPNIAIYRLMGTKLSKKKEIKGCSGGKGFNS